MSWRGITPSPPLDRSDTMVSNNDQLRDRPLLAHPSSETSPVPQGRAGEPGHQLRDRPLVHHQALAQEDDLAHTGRDGGGGGEGKGEREWDREKGKGRKKGERLGWGEERESTLHARREATTALGSDGSCGILTNMLLRSLPSLISCGHTSPRWLPAGSIHTIPCHPFSHSRGQTSPRWRPAADGWRQAACVRRRRGP